MTRPFRDPYGDHRFDPPDDALPTCAQCGAPIDDPADLCEGCQEDVATKAELARLREDGE